ncbi:MAG: ATP synthase F0 subunit B [Thermodesulfobacteriota bacterium]|nr:ATP synthase F0 subunit B [Thermodesulfobacteriota bacterium]
MISLNITILIQVVIFLSFLWILNKFLFTPIISVLDKRIERTKGLNKKAIDTDKEVHEKIKDYEERLEEARIKAKDIKEAIKKEGVEEERNIINDVIRETNNIIKDKKGGIYKEAQIVNKELKKEINIVSNAIVEKVLGRRVN